MPKNTAAVRLEDITIAVTVYNRRQFIFEAVQSALDQKFPVRVIVVEDCGPDNGMRDAVLAKFGGRIEYMRNPRNRGLFDNWNACLEYCQTPWISILHDDDLLLPCFTEAVIHLAKEAPNRGVYFGSALSMRPDGVLRPLDNTPCPEPWWDIDLVRFANDNLVLFPGQLIRVSAAREVGGFRKASYFTGDWDMWFNLALRFGAAQTATEVAVGRVHPDEGRGTSYVERKGWKWALDNVQRKRNRALLRSCKGITIPFDRTSSLRCSPIPLQPLLRHGSGFSRRMLRYNRWLVLKSQPPNLRYAILRELIRVFGPGSLRLPSAILRRLYPPAQPRALPTPQ